MSFIERLTSYVASAPGISLPLDISFKPYSKFHLKAASRQNSVGKSSIPKADILLHSAVHAKLDYVGREEPDGSTNGLLRHYVGIYDPKTADLKVIPARKVVVRSTLRSPAHDKEDDIEAEVPNVSPTSFPAHMICSLTCPAFCPLTARPNVWH